MAGSTPTTAPLTVYLGLAGFGVPDPRDADGNWLSDGHDTPEAALAAARAELAADLSADAQIGRCERAVADGRGGWVAGDHGDV